MATPTLERLVLTAFAGLGDIDGQEDEALSLNIATSGVANYIFKRPLEMAAETSTNVDLSAIFESCSLVAVMDTTKDSAGGLLVGGNTDKQTLSANGAAIWTVKDTAPNLYFTSPAGQVTHIEIIAIGKRTG